MERTSDKLIPYIPSPIIGHFYDFPFYSSNFYPDIKLQCFNGDSCHSALTDVTDWSLVENSVRL